MDRRRHDHNHDECCVQSVSFSAGDSIADSLGTSVEDCSEGSLQTSLLQDFFAHREQHDDVGDPGLSEMVKAVFPRCPEKGSGVVRHMDCWDADRLLHVLYIFNKFDVSTQSVAQNRQEVQV